MTKNTESPCTCEKTSCPCGQSTARSCTCGDDCRCQAQCKCGESCECAAAK